MHVCGRNCSLSADRASVRAVNLATATGAALYLVLAPSSMGMVLAALEKAGVCMASNLARVAQWPVQVVTPLNLNALTSAEIWHWGPAMTFAEQG